MKRQIAVGIVLFAGFSVEAMSDCSTNRVTLRSEFAGYTFCGKRGTESWQEEHQGTGNGASALLDYKLGGGPSIDPRKQVGTWQASNGANSLVTYNYTGGASYTYSVYKIGTSADYSFCTGTTEVVRARRQAGTGAACSSYATLP